MDPILAASRATARATIASSIIAGVVAIAVAGFGPLILSRLDTIHTLTNSNLTAINERLDVANREIISLNALIAEMRAPSAAPRTGPDTAPPASVEMQGDREKP